MILGGEKEGKRVRGRKEGRKVRGKEERKKTIKYRIFQESAHCVKTQLRLFTDCSALSGSHESCFIVKPL